MDRRTFIATTAAGIAGTTLTPVSAEAATISLSSDDEVLTLISSEDSIVTELEGEPVPSMRLKRVLLRARADHTEIMRNHRVVWNEYSDRFDLEVDGKLQSAEHGYDPKDFVVRPMYHETVATIAQQGIQLFRETVRGYCIFVWITIECADGRRCHHARWMHETWTTRVGISRVEVLLLGSK